MNSHDIIDRDLKPEKCISHDRRRPRIGWGLKPVIADFGMARPVKFPIKGASNPSELRQFREVANIAPREYANDEPLLSDVEIGEKTTVFHIAYLMHEFLYC